MERLQVDAKVGQWGGTVGMPGKEFSVGFLNARALGGVTLPSQQSGTAAACTPCHTMLHASASAPRCTLNTRALLCLQAATEARDRLQHECEALRSERGKLQVRYSVSCVVPSRVPPLDRPLIGPVKSAGRCLVPGSSAPLSDSSLAFVELPVVYSLFEQ